MANIEVIYSVEQFISIILRTTQSETESVIEHECHRQDIRFLDCCHIESRQYKQGSDFDDHI